jgi:hypothetical protein
MHQSQLIGVVRVVLCCAGPAVRLELSVAPGIGTKCEHFGAWRRGSRQGMARINDFGAAALGTVFGSSVGIWHLAFGIWHLAFIYPLWSSTVLYLFFENKGMKEAPPPCSATHEKR